jgi:hypothetical protein
MRSHDPTPNRHQIATQHGPDLPGDLEFLSGRDRETPNTGVHRADIAVAIGHLVRFRN